MDNKYVPFICRQNLILLQSRPDYTRELFVYLLPHMLLLTEILCKTITILNASAIILWEGV